MGSRGMLQRKRESLLLLAKDLEHCMRERDQLRSLVKKFVASCACSQCSFLVALENDSRLKAISQSANDCPDPVLSSSKQRDQEIRKQKRIIDELLKQKVHLKDELALMQTKLDEAMEDIKLLRQTVARQRVGSSGRSGTVFKTSTLGGDESSTDVDADSRLESLVSELESVKLRNEKLELELFASREKHAEQNTEKEFYVNRSERLNIELNHILAGDPEKAILDIDALALENNHLKSQLAQAKYEKEIIDAHYLKLKQMTNESKLSAKKPEKSFFKKSTSRSVQLRGENCKFLSTKEVKQYLMGTPGKSFPVNSKSVESLHALSVSLTEAIEEKNMALSHQKNTNKALGIRVAELETKLKSLESDAVSAVVRDREQIIKSLKFDINDLIEIQKDMDRREPRFEETSQFSLNEKSLSFNVEAIEPFDGRAVAECELMSDSSSKQSDNILSSVKETPQSVGDLSGCFDKSDGTLLPDNKEVFEKFFSSIDCQLSLPSDSDIALQQINPNHAK